MIPEIVFFVVRVLAICGECSVAVLLCDSQQFTWFGYRIAGFRLYSIIYIVYSLVEKLHAFDWRNRADDFHPTESWFGNEARDLRKGH